MVSVIHHYLKAAALKWLLVWEKWVQCTFQGWEWGGGNGKEPLQLSGSRLLVNWWSGPLNGFLTSS